MTKVALATLGFAVLFAVIGSPTALCLRRKDGGWIATAVDALLLGVVWAAGAVAVWSWLSWWGLAVVLLVFGWTAGGAWHRRAEWPPMRSPASVPRGEVVAGLAWFVVLAVAALLRLREVNFLPWIGDMGAYVNWANEFARTGHLSSTWPPLFSSYLAIASALFGPEHTTIGVPVLGMALIVGISRLLVQLSVPRTLGLVAGAVVALQPHAVWFSSFPASESLNAPIFVLWLLLVHRAALDGRRTAVAAAAGAVMLALQLLRGSAAISLVPLVVAAGAALIVPRWRSSARGLLTVLVASTVADGVGFWYGISKIQKYFVNDQLESLLPNALTSGLSRWGLLLPGFRAALAIVLVIAAVAIFSWLALLVAERRPAVSRLVSRWHSGSGALLVVAGLCLGVGTWVFTAHYEVSAILSRIGLPIIVLAVLAIVLVAWLRSSDVQALTLMAGLLLILYVGLHAVRLGTAREHAFFLYWDRYLYSEAFPLLVVLAVLGVATAVRMVIPHPAGDAKPAAWQPWQMPILGSALAAVAVAPGLSNLRLAVADEFLEGAEGLTNALAVVAKGEGDVPVVWSSSSGRIPQGWVFPNTWMAFAVPLERSFGVDVVGITRGDTSDFAPDPVVDEAALDQLGACSGSDRLVLFESEVGAQPADERLAGTGLSFTSLGDYAAALPLLSSPPEKGWQTVGIDIQAWLVVLDSFPADDDAGCAT